MKKLKLFSQMTGVALFTGLLSIAAFGQTATTSGSVTMTGNVSNYVDLTSGGSAVLTGDSSGSVTAPGSTGDPINVVANLGELGPSNLSSFVKLTVPLRVRSNASYQISMKATVDSGSATRGINSSDVGFGVGSVTRSGVGVNSEGSDTGSAEDPTSAAGGTNATTGRYEFTAAANRLANYSSSTEVLSGDYVLEPVPTTNNQALTANTYFAIKPQFFQGSSNTTISVTFTATTQP